MLYFYWVFPEAAQSVCQQSIHLVDDWRSAWSCKQAENVVNKSSILVILLVWECHLITDNNSKWGSTRSPLNGMRCLSYGISTCNISITLLTLINGFLSQKSHTVWTYCRKMYTNIVASRRFRSPEHHQYYTFNNSLFFFEKCDKIPK